MIDTLFAVLIACLVIAVARIWQLHGEIEGWRSTCQKIEATHDRTIESITATHQETVNHLNTIHGETVATLRAIHQDDIDALVAKYEGRPAPTPRVTVGRDGKVVRA